MLNKFTEHPQKVGETYQEHFLVASKIGYKCFKIGFCCLIHALFPWMHETTGSDAIIELYDDIKSRRQK